MFKACKGLLLVLFIIIIRQLRAPLNYYFASN